MEVGLTGSSAFFSTFGLSGVFLTGGFSPANADACCDLGFSTLGDCCGVLLRAADCGALGFSACGACNAKHLVNGFAAD